MYEKNRHSELIKESAEELLKQVPAEMKKASKVKEACPAGCGKKGLKSEAEL